MSMNVVELFPNRPTLVMPAPEYFMQWVTESGIPERKYTTDRASVRRQLDSCRRRGLVACVECDGEICGGVVGLTLPRGKSYRATLHDENWGDF